MRRIHYYIELEKYFLLLGLYTLVEYPLDTLIWIIAMILRESSGFVGLLLIAQKLEGLEGWNFYAICVLFGMAMITESLGQSFADAIWSIGSRVRSGKFDMYLVRPAPILMQLIGSRCNLQAISTFVMGLVVLGLGWNNEKIPLSLGNILFVFEFSILGTILNSSIYLIFNSLNFWFINSNNVADLAVTIRQFAKYPLSIFPKVVTIGMTYLIPFGFVGYYPSSYLMGKTNWNIPLILPCVTLAVLIVAGGIWKAGIKGYNSTGT